MPSVILVDHFDGPAHVAESRASAFQRMGLKVVRFDYRAEARRHGSRRRDRQIVELCADLQPDFVFFAKCNDVSAAVIDECNQTSRTVLWYMDPLNDNFSDALKEKIRRCTLTACASELPYQQARELSPNVHLVEQAYDPLHHHPVEVAEDIDVSFIGTLRGQRRRYHKSIGFRHIGGVFGRAHSEAVCRTRINLNFTMGPGEISVRFFKVLASRGFLLTQPWPGMESHFAPGEHFALFQSVDDLRRQIDYYLGRPDERRAIADAGYRAVQGFTWSRFAQRIVALLETGIDPGPGMVDGR